MRAAVTAFVLGLIGLSFAPVNPQAAVGVIQGTVVSGGVVVPGVAVGLWRPPQGSGAQGTTQLGRHTTTDSQGRFRFEQVPQGTYELRFALNGFVPVTKAVTVTEKPVPVIQVEMRSAAVKRQATVAELVVDAVSRARADRTEMGRSMPSAAPMIAQGVGFVPPPFNTESYDYIQENRFRRVGTEPVSTFSVDVDTASYANMRRFLNDGTLPPADAVRTEELINYFRFAYPDAPAREPFSVTTEVAACPWNPRHRLALIGLQARRIPDAETPPRNLVFLLDVSGSMMPPNKLPLVKTAMRMLVDTLKPADRVAIVVYAGASGLVLPSTPGDRKADIQRAIAELNAGGSTNGAAGIQLAYDTAAKAFVKSGINRVILATDGDFNVGVTSQGELVRLIEEQRERGIFLSVLGVGTGNVKDSTMEKLADKGNGNYAYLDSLHEARRVLIAEAGATLLTVAKDVKIQVEFNPRAVAAYRLIGYENRMLNREDFNDDRKDAGEIGSGHTVTALYELVPPGEPIQGPEVDPLKYQEPTRPTSSASSGELMTVKLRYKESDGDTSRLTSIAVREQSRELTPNLGFAAAVAEFAMLLRRSEFKGQATWESARALARQHRGNDPDGYRAEFIRLVELAAALDTQNAASPQSRR
jgi:Ca-activated chloride channel family protein